MQRTTHVLRYIGASFGLHLLLAAAALLAAGRATAPRETVPVSIVSLPPEAVKRLPPMTRPVPARPEPAAPRQAVPPRSAISPTGDAKVPRTAPIPPAGAPSGEGAGRGGEALPHGGSLPFLSQTYIDELAKKGMPAARPGDESVTLDTDEFKYISYNRWLKLKVESALRYPELAAISGYSGVLYLKFDIMPDGSLAGLELLKSSGYKILDDEALRAIRASAPFAPLPSEWNMQRYSIRAAVVYYLSGAYIR